MKGLKIQEIEALVEFVLFGEVKVQQDQMNAFLKAADDLKVKELCNLDQENAQKVLSDDNLNSNSDMIGDGDETLDAKEAVLTTYYSCKLCDKDYTGNKAGKVNLKIHMRRNHEKVRYPCSHCDFQASGVRELNRHIQEIHEGIIFECEYEDCNYKNSRKYMVKYHVQFKHEGIYYPCDMCGERFMYPPVIKQKKE